MIEKVLYLVGEILCKEDSGHGMDHVKRVYDLAVRFAQEEKANQYTVALIALLHEVDDYKLFGLEQANELTNAKKILDEINIDEETRKIVLDSIKTMGYSKCLQGIRPTFIEGKIVSDADMCDVVGVNGIIRSYTFALKHGNSFFDRNVFPENDLDSNKYISKTGSAVNHLFEKSLRIKKLMLTEAGKKEIESRHQVTINILYHLFQEENAIEWKEYLDKFLSENYE